MDFGLTREQQETKERAAEFADREVAPGAAERDLNDVYPEEIFDRMSDEGFMGLCVPEEYGGAGLDFLSYVLLLEELIPSPLG